MDLNKIIKREIYNAGIDENLQQMEKHYIKTGIFTEEDKENVLEITDGDNYTKAVADIYVWMNGIGKYGIHGGRREYDHNTKKALHEFYKDLQYYDKNYFPIKNLEIFNNTLHPLVLFSAIRSRKKIKNILSKVPSIFLRNLKSEIKKPRDERELEYIVYTIERINEKLKLIEKLSDDKKNVIFRKIFSSNNTTFEDVEKKLSDLDILFLNHNDGIEEIRSKIDDEIYYGEAKILYENDDIIVVDVKSSDAMKSLGCGSMWCFTTENGSEQWSNYANDSHVNLVYNFNEEPDSKTRMVVVLPGGDVYNMYNEHMGVDDESESGYDYLNRIGVMNSLNVINDRNYDDDDLDENQNKMKSPLLKEHYIEYKQYCLFESDDQYLRDFVLYDSKIKQSMLDYENSGKYILGYLTLRLNEKYNCYEVDTIAATNKFGPLMYMIGMTYAGNKGIIPTRASSKISNEAIRVWKEFYEGKGKSYVNNVDLPEKTHEQDFLNKKYTIKTPINLNILRINNKKVIGNDPYEEKSDFIWGLGDDFGRNEMGKIYNEVNENDIEKTDIGFYEIEDSLAPLPTDLFVSHLELYDQYRGRGYFKELLGDIKKYAENENKNRIILEPDITQGKEYRLYLEKLYTKYGFEKMKDDPSLLVLDLNTEMVMNEYDDYSSMNDEHIEKMVNYVEKENIDNTNISNLFKTYLINIHNIDKALKMASDDVKYFTNLIAIQNKLKASGLISEDLVYWSVDDATKDNFKLNTESLNEDISELDQNDSNKISTYVANKLNLGATQFINHGSYGYAYSANNKIIKVTTDKSEAIESLKLKGKTPNRLAHVYNVYLVSYNTKSYYVVVGEKVEIREDEVLNIVDRIDEVAYRKFEFGYPELIALYYHYPQKFKQGYEIEMFEALNNYPREKEFFKSILKIVDEVKSYNIKSPDFINPLNLGYRNGKLVFFDLGASASNKFGKVKPEKIDVAENENQINEIGDMSSTIYNYHLVRSNEVMSHYKFNTEKHDYLVTIRHFHGDLSVSYFFYDNDGLSIDMTNEGNPIKTISTVIKILDDDLRKRKEEFKQTINTISFTPKKEFERDDRRKNINLAYLRKLKPNWKYSENSDGAVIIDIMESETMDLNEVGEATVKGINYQTVLIVDDMSFHIFETNNYRYKVYVYVQNNDLLLEFNAIHNDTGEKMQDKQTNEGYLYKIMSTIVQIIKQELEDRKNKFNQIIQHIIFSPEQENNNPEDHRREKLYYAYLRRLKPEWRYEKDSKYGENSFKITITNNITESHHSFSKETYVTLTDEELDHLFEKAKKFYQTFGIEKNYISGHDFDDFLYIHTSFAYNYNRMEERFGSKFKRIFKFIDYKVRDRYNKIPSDEKRPVFERKISYMPDSESVEVKDECKLGKVDGKSKACNVGDINNLSLKNINEKNSKNSLLITEEKVKFGCLMVYFDIPKWDNILKKINDDDLYDDGSGTFGKENEPHCTILYGFHDSVSSDDFKEILDNLEAPISIKIKNISLFENKDFDVVKLECEPNDILINLRKKVENFPCTLTYKNFNPHMTIAYVKSGEGKKYVYNFNNAITLISNKIVFSTKNRERTEFLIKK